MCTLVRVSASLYSLSALTKALTMIYTPQKITKAVLRRVAKAEPPDTPREILDRSRGILLRHQPSGYMAIYAQLGRGKRERICNARDILDDHNPLTLTAVFEKAKVLHGESATGRDFAGERNAQRGVPTLTKYLDETYEPWAAAERRSGEATVARLRSCFEIQFGKRRLTELTPATLDRWTSKRRKDGIKAETINRDLSALRAALGRAVKLEIIAKNPLSGMEELEVDRHKQVVRALTATEKGQLIKALEDRDAAKWQQRANSNERRIKRGKKPWPNIGRFDDVLTPAVIISLETGVRRGELFNMEWGRSVDFEARTIHVRGKTYETREIPLNKFAFETLRDWWLQCGQLKSGYVFSISGRRLGDLKKSYHPVLAAAGIKRVNANGLRVNWHSLRHTFGTLLGAAGVDPTTLMKLMGHANMATTQRYLHTDQDRKREAVERLTEAL